MALKKQINETEFLYGVIGGVEYSKTKPLCFLFCIKKMNNNNEILQIDSMHFYVPDVIEEFSIQALNVDDNNLYKAIYVWLKENKPLFADWVDC